MNFILIKPLKQQNSVYGGPTGPPWAGPGSWVHGQDPGPGLRDPGPGIPKGNPPEDIQLPANIPGSSYFTIKL